jgi:hypothetical protein
MCFCGDAEVEGFGGISVLFWAMNRLSGKCYEVLFDLTIKKIYAGYTNQNSANNAQCRYPI